MFTRLPGTRAISIAIAAALLLGLALADVPVAAAARSHASHKDVLRQGNGTRAKRSARVWAVQSALQRAGFRVHKVDGRFGRSTRAAVRRFQRRNGLRVDGEVGPSTRRALGLTAAFTRIHFRHVRAQRADRRRVAVARQARAERRRALADRRRERAIPTPHKGTSDVAGLATASTVHAAIAAPAPTAAPTPASGATTTTRRGIPGGPDLAAALMTLLIIATWLVARQPAVRRQRTPALALGGGGAATIGWPAPPAAPPAPAPRTTEPATPPAAAVNDDAGEQPRKAALVTRAAPTPPRSLDAGDPVIAYIDTSAGVGGRAAKKIERTCARRGWDLLEVVAERGDRPAGDRPGLAYVLERIEKGEANALVIRDIADLGRRGVNRAALKRRVRGSGAALVTCVPGDTPVIEQRSDRAARPAATRRGPVTAVAGTATHHTRFSRPAQAFGPGVAPLRRGRRRAP